MSGPRLRFALVAALLGLGCLSLAVQGARCTDGGQAQERDAMEDGFANERRRMVERQLVTRGIRDDAVLEAMRTVPRHEFVPDELLDDAYGDHPLPIGEGQTISQPYIVALMTQALRPTVHDRVLELGTGSGYQAAVLAALVDSVYSIEYVPSLADHAAATLSRLGYDNVVVRAGDGWGGWPEHAPYDAAIVTFAAPEVPPALIEQVRPGGRICIPLGRAHAVQELMLYTRREDGRLIGRSLGAVRFVPVLGEGAGRDR